MFIKMNPIDMVISCSEAFWLYIRDNLYHDVRIVVSTRIEDFSLINVSFLFDKDSNLFYASIVFLKIIKFNIWFIFYTLFFKLPLLYLKNEVCQASSSYSFVLASEYYCVALKHFLPIRIRHSINSSFISHCRQWHCFI